MDKQVDYKNQVLRYRDEGKGYPLVFLHGYLETLEIWNELTPLLTDRFRIIRPDLPGHGKSGILEKVHSMDLMAGSVAFLLQKLNIDHCLMFGHSMGGYVTLAFAENHGELLDGFSLVHSHCFPDPDEKKLNRDREIQLIRKGKKMQLIQNHVPKTFATDHVDDFKDARERILQYASNIPDVGIISALEGMKVRPDRSAFLQSTELPVQVISGDKDNFITREVTRELYALPKNLHKVRLENSGHMGIIEEPQKVAQGISDFYGRI